MISTREQLDSFHRFVTERIEQGTASATLSDLFDLWSISHPSPQELEDNIRAVEASLCDMEAGETGRPFDQFMNEFRQRYQISPDA